MAGMRQRWAKWAVNVCRAVLAATFVFSGFTKAVDPIGTQYKIRDYLAAWQMAGIVPDALTLAASVAVSAAEFTLGVCLIASKKKSIMGEDYKHPTWLLVCGIIVVIASAYLGITTFGSNLSQLL